MNSRWGTARQGPEIHVAETGGGESKTLAVDKITTAGTDRNYPVFPKGHTEILIFFVIPY